MSLFSLQGNPALLVPWMAYTIFFLVANTALYILSAVEFFTLNDNTNGAGNIAAAVIYVCK
jgi:hypothetical protein